MKIYRLLLILLMSLVLGTAAIGCGKKSVETPASEPETQVQEEEVEEAATPAAEEQSNQQNAVTIDPNKQYFAVLQTNMGQIRIKFFPKEAPKTVQNFVQLAKSDFYTSNIFHRVIADFMIQGGAGRDMNGPGYTFEDEINSIKMVKGKVAMANSGPNSNSSQFFIVTAQSTPWLDGKHTVFGEVVEGMETVNKIGVVETDPADKPVRSVVITSVTIEEK